MLTAQDYKDAGFTPEIAEEARKSIAFSGWPAPVRRYRLAVESFSMAIEEPYFWTIEYLSNMLGFTETLKIQDIFTASEQSSFFGSGQQRLGLQQDKISQFLATIGKMVKEIFQLVRELRILDERLGYYADSYASTSKSRGSAEITLKGIWVDMVEQGAKNPASVYGMAREVQFTTLPDLFFNIHPLKQEDCDEVVDREAGQFNKKVREVLKRKLRSYLAWKEHTYEELKNRRVFTLKYLRQHYEVIKMYMTWVKPYLKNVERMTFDQGRQDTIDVITAFERSIIEIEILATKKVGELYKCLNVHFFYSTRPDMNYHQEYQRGPIHMGKVQMTMRGYVWTDEQISTYQQMRSREDFHLLGLVDGSVKAAMDSLGDELMRYLEEAGEAMAPRTTPDVAEKSSGRPRSRGFFSVNEKVRAHRAARKKKQTSWQAHFDRDKATEAIKKDLWTLYHHFKKHHNMLNW